MNTNLMKEMKETPMNPADTTEVKPQAAATASVPQYIYALGQITPRFPLLSIEKEYLQALGRGDVAGLTDRESLHKTLADPQNRYLARQLCWVFSVEGIETYLLAPRGPEDLNLLIESIRPRPKSMDVDLIIGRKGGLSTPAMCNGLILPIVMFDQIYSFDVETLAQALPRPKGMGAERFTAAAEELFQRVMQLADNAGADDEHRALNYLLVRYPALYNLTAEKFAENAALRSVEVKQSRLSGARTIVDVVLAYAHRVTDIVDKYFVRVDVTEEFPFLASRLQPYFDR